MRNFIKKQEGQAMIEFAMVVPILVVLFLFIIAGGQVMYVKHMVQQAAYEAVRSVVAQSFMTNNNTQTQPIANISTKARESAAAFLQQMPLMVVTTDNLTIQSLTLENNCWVKGKEVSVTLEYKFKPIFPLSFAVDANGNMSSIGKMVQTVENGSTEPGNVTSASGTVCS